MSVDRFLLLNCGTTHLSGAVFTKSGTSLRLDDFFSEDLPVDADEGPVWEAALAEAWGRLQVGRQLPSAVRLIAPGGLTLAKIIKVPHVGADRQAQAVAYEVAQNLPHPLPEVAWDYHVTSDDGIETEVIALAIKNEAAESLCRSFSSRGQEVDSLSAAPVLDVNAWRLTHPGASPPALLLHIGARSTNLVFINEDSFLLRNIPLGGGTLTQAVADTMGSSFAAAEELKVGFFSGTRRLPDGDPAIGILHSQTQAFLRRLGTELTRSVVAYRRQKPDAAPVRAYLTGRGSLLPGLPEFLEEKLGVPVGFFDPTTAVELPPHLAAAHDGFFHQVSELVGAAATFVDPEAAQIELLPAARQTRRQLKNRLPWLLAAAAAVTLAAWVPGLGWTLAAGQARDQAAELRALTAPLAALEADLARETARVTALQDRIQRTEGLVDSKANWINFFADLQARLVAVEDVWLEELEVLRPPAEVATEPAPVVNPDEAWETAAAPAPVRPPLRLRLAGRMLDFENPVQRVSADVQRRVNRLLDSFGESAFIAEVEDKRFDTSENGLLRFEFTLVVNPEKPL